MPAALVFGVIKPNGRKLMIGHIEEELTELCEHFIVEDSLIHY